MSEKKSRFAQAIITRLLRDVGLWSSQEYNKKVFLELVDTLTDYVSHIELDYVRSLAHENLQNACEALWDAVSNKGRESFVPGIVNQLCAKGFSEAAGILSPEVTSSEQESGVMVSETEGYIASEPALLPIAGASIPQSTDRTGDSLEYAELIVRLNRECSRTDLDIIKSYLRRRFSDYKEINVREDACFENVVRSLERLTLVDRQNVQILIDLVDLAQSLSGFREELRRYHQQLTESGLPQLPGNTQAQWPSE